MNPKQELLRGLWVVLGAHRARKLGVLGSSSSQGSVFRV